MISYLHMELFFAKFLGLYFLIMGVLILMRRKAVMPAIKDLLKNRALLLILAVVEIAAGIALVLAFPVVSLTVPGIVALVGYMMVIEGILYLAAPAKFVQKFIGSFNRPWWYVVGGSGAIIAGVYLAGYGFGLI